jgi:hypothetical protein
MGHTKKNDSHRRIRTHNRNCDDDSIEYFNCKIGKMNKSMTCGYFGPQRNVPHMPNNIYNFKNWSKYKWHNDGDNLLETIDIFKKLSIIDYGYIQDSQYLNACKKQIERRGNVGIFYGHQRDKHCDLYT